MSLTYTSFSFPSARRLSKYLGEMDALVEVTELAARLFLSAASQSGNVGEFIAAASREHGICVNLGEIASLSRHLARNYIVTVYQSAECFLYEFRREHRGLYKKDWIGDGDDVDPLTVALRNIASSQEEAEGLIGRDLISRFQYYRVVRNWVVHTKGSDLSKPQEKFKEIVKYSTKHQEMFGALTAPNPPDKLTFDDFVFFSRLTKQIASQFCQVAQPPVEHWAKAIALTRFKRLANNPQRMRNSVAGRIKTEFGIDEETATWIANELCDSLA